MPKKLLLILVLIMVSNIGCINDEKFDSEIWKSKEIDWWMTNIRENMVNDLIESDM